MAVSKLWSVTSRLGQVIDYAANPEKTATDIYTEEQYQALRDVLSYVEKCKELSLYDTGVTAKYGDKLLTLSTCEYSRTNGRLVVVAKLINE